MMGISSSVNLGFNLQQTAQKAGERFKAADTDSDEHISRKEFGDFAELRGIDSNRMNKIFARLDRNGDSQISQSEQQDVISFMRERKESLISSQVGSNRGFDLVKSLMGPSEDDSRICDMKHRWQGALEEQRTDDYYAAKRAESEFRIESMYREVDLFA